MLRLVAGVCLDDGEFKMIVVFELVDGRPGERNWSARWKHYGSDVVTVAQLPYTPLPQVGVLGVSMGDTTIEA